MIPLHLKQKLKVEAPLQEWTKFCFLIKDSSYFDKVTIGRMDLNNLLLISHIDNKIAEIFPKMMKCSHEGKQEMSVKLSVPELLSFWKVISITPNPSNLALDIVAQIDQHAQNLSHLVTLNPKKP